MLKYFFLFISIILLEPIIAQKDYADFILDSLCSDEMKGRGYVSQGDLKAAQFIKREYQKIGLRKYFHLPYFQEFDFAINTFPDTLSLSINGKVLKPGKSFLIESSSGSQKGVFSAVSIKKKQLLSVKKMMKQVGKDKLKNVFLIINKDELKNKEEQELYHNTLMTIKQYEGFQLAGIIEKSKSKLTWNTSTKYTGIPIIQLYSDSFPDPIKTINIHIKHHFHRAYISQNVIGFIEGTHVPDTFIYITAHYDHLGMMGGNTIFRGANDNASGIAMLLSLAKYYKENPPKYSIMFIAFGGEEIGLLGSQYFVKHPFIPFKNIKALLNFDILGTGDEGLCIVNGVNHSEDVKTINYFNDLNQYVPKIKVRNNAPNSDHYFFAKKGVKALFFYTMGGIQAYHDIYDHPKTLSLKKFDNVLNLMINYINYTQKIIY